MFYFRLGRGVAVIPKIEQPVLVARHPEEDDDFIDRAVKDCWAGISKLSRRNG
jgi:hypothetical protein